MDRVLDTLHMQYFNYKKKYYLILFILQSSQVYHEKTSPNHKAMKDNEAIYIFPLLLKRTAQFMNVSDRMCI